MKTRRWLAIGVAVLACSCGEPVRERAIEALGPEDDAVAPGPLHRPGQRCVLCHDGEDADVPAFSIAGTVYVDADLQLPAANVEIDLLDAEERRITVTSNCAGNFYAERERFAPTFPVWTALRHEDYRIAMVSPIGRDGSCATCHIAQATRQGTDVVYLFSLPDETFPRGDCP